MYRNTRRMKTVFGALAVLFFLCGTTQARDAFDAIRCEADIPKVLIGKVMPDGTAVKSEDQHKAIRLKDLGAEEISDRLQMVAWSICGSDYNMLVDGKGVMRDVLPFPVHSRSTPEFSGFCKIGGKDTTGIVYALLDNRTGFDANPEHHYSPGDGTYLPAIAAWRVDEKQAKFIKMSVAGLTCPRSGLNSVDGGP